MKSYQGLVKKKQEELAIELDIQNQIVNLQNMITELEYSIEHDEEIWEMRNYTDKI